MRVSGRIRGVSELRQGLAQGVEILRAEMSKAMRASLFTVTRTAQKEFLSGPRPERLGVRSGRLRASLNEGDRDLIYRVEDRQAQVVGTVGTNVVYAAIHETGGIIRPIHGRYLAVPTMLALSASGVLKPQYNRPLKEIPGLVIIRTKSGVLFAQERQPAMGRQRRSIARALFWLVRKVTIPPRPYLGPALRRSGPAITGLFAAALRAVERQLQGKLR